MNLLYLSGIILAFFLSILLVTKTNKSRADYILMVWLAFCGFHLTTFYLIFTDQVNLHPHLVSLGVPLPIIHGPFLFLYTSYQTSNKPFKFSELWHFLPLLIFFIWFADFYLLSNAEKITVYRAQGNPYADDLVYFVYFIYVTGTIYILMSAYRLVIYRKNLVNQFSNIEKINFNWLMYLIIWLGLIWVVVIFVQLDEFIFAIASLLILWMGYFGIKQVRVFSQINPLEELPDVNVRTLGIKTYDDERDTSLGEDLPVTQKYQKSILSDADIQHIYQRLKILMDTEKPFLDPDLTLSDLAAALHTHPNYLSQVINTCEEKNFYDLVNLKRIEEFLKLSTEPASQQFTLLANAFACGFNSKASFNRNFKKYTGATPSEYLKNKAPEKRKRAKIHVS